MPRFWLLICLLGFVGTLHAQDGQRGVVRMNANGEDIKVYTYRPDCQNPAILLVFHGIHRDAKKYRNRAQQTADDLCLMVFAPRFDKKRFPNWRYQRGGILDHGQRQARETWPGLIVQALIAQAQTLIANSAAPVYVFGHSAGAQFLSRVAAYTPLTAVTRIVIANPSSHVMPSLQVAAPYGFNALLSEFENVALLKAYLASPITIYLGQQDTGAKNLLNNAQAQAQGANRLARGRTVFEAARDAAKQRGWAFNWQLVEVAGVGHSAKKMLRAAEFYRAIGVESAQTLPEAVGQ